MLILRDAQIQPFVNDQYVDLDMLLDDILELDDEYDATDSHSDTNHSGYYNNLPKPQNAAANASMKKRALHKRTAVLERMRQREIYMNAVENMRDYIEKRLSKNDMWWTKLQRDFDKLLIQPSITNEYYNNEELEQSLAQQERNTAQVSGIF